VLSCVAALSLGGHVARAQGDEIPFQLQDKLIRVPVVINGSKVDAVLDSGTGSFGLDRAFASSLGLHPRAKDGEIPGGGAAVPMFPVDLAQIEFGPERLSQIAGIALDMGNLSSSAGFPVKALLGQPVFLPQPISIDYPDRKISFLPASTKVSCADPIAFSLVGGTPVIAVSLRATPTSDVRTLHLIVDLGTRHYAAMLGGPFLDTAEGKLLDKAGKPMQVGTGTGGAVSGTVATVSSLTVGGRAFPNLEIALTRHVGAFSSGIADGTLGIPLWEAGTIIFDYPHHQICLNLPKPIASN
jgi:hypothetical protein